VTGPAVARPAALPTDRLRRFLIATSSATRKARNLAVDPAVTVTVDDRHGLEWVSAVGTAELITGPESRRLNHRLYARWMTAEGLDVVGGWLHAWEDVTVVVTPHRWLSWSWVSDVVPELSAAGVAMDDPARWFRF
jgi:Pyridoxamine 5'-phosphate oxidase